MKKLNVLTAALWLLSTAAAGAIDLSAPIRNLDGTPVPQSATDPTPVTLGTVIETALISPTPIDSPSGEEKARRYWLAQKVHSRKENLTAEEIALIKKVVGGFYGPLVVGRVIELIDPAAVPRQD